MVVPRTQTFDVGFDNPFTLSPRFKKYVGVSPTEYRKRFRSGYVKRGQGSKKST